MFIQLVTKCAKTTSLLCGNFNCMCGGGSEQRAVDVLTGFPGINTLKPRQNGRHFPDDIFKWIFLNENVWVSIKISLKFVARGPINNIPTLVQLMAWRRLGDKPLSKPMMVRLPTHICVTRPQWVNTMKRKSSPQYWFCGKETTCHRWFPTQKASYVEYHCFSLMLASINCWT